MAHIFLPKKFMIVAHFFWEVIVSDLAHEKSELAQLCLLPIQYTCMYFISHRCTYYIILPVSTLQRMAIHRLPPKQGEE